MIVALINRACTRASNNELCCKAKVGPHKLNQDYKQAVVSESTQCATLSHICKLTAASMLSLFWVHFGRAVMKEENEFGDNSS